MMRLGLFGGTFDPVHLGHLLLAECCREQRQLDRVLFLPAGTPPHKRDRELTDAEMRVEMLELALAGRDDFEVSRHEVDRGGVSYTVDTLRRFHEEYPGSELFFLVGADMLRDLPHWREAATVCQLATIVAVCRSGSPALDFSVLRETTSPDRIEAFRRCQVEMPEIEISSSDLRSRIAEGRSIRYRTSRAVEVYIETHGLYVGPRNLD
jgi:nicotinate-nucleotide adenylyltransferase